MEQPIISDSAKSFGENMLEDQPEKILSRQGACLGGFGVAVDVLKGDLSILISEDVSLTDDPTIEISTQVLECLFSMTNSLAVGYPLLFINGGD